MTCFLGVNIGRGLLGCNSSYGIERTSHRGNFLELHIYFCSVNFSTASIPYPYQTSDGSPNSPKYLNTISLNWLCQGVSIFDYGGIFVDGLE